MMLSILLFLSLNFFPENYPAPDPLPIKKSLNILILGNSVTISAPTPASGWYGDWGMAASAADKDYVSILNNKLASEKKYSSISIHRKSLALWEHNFRKDLSQYSDNLNSQYDIMIVCLGDNVNETDTQFTYYEQELTKLINHFKSSGTKVIIAGTFWNSPAKDTVHKKIADDNGFSYVSFSDLQQQKSNFATGKFADPQISAHPSDKGMEEIANLLFKQIISIY